MPSTYSNKFAYQHAYNGYWQQGDAKLYRNFKMLESLTDRLSHFEILNTRRNSSRRILPELDMRSSTELRLLSIRELGLCSDFLESWGKILGMSKLSFKMFFKSWSFVCFFMCKTLKTFQNFKTWLTKMKQSLGVKNSVSDLWSKSFLELSYNRAFPI